MIKITVSGLTSSGKTSVAVLIEKALKEAGLNVMPFENLDGDADAKREFMQNPDMRKIILDKLLLIMIEEVNLRRMS